jgi:hypothetical protein
MMNDVAGNIWSPANNFNNIPYWDYSQGYHIKLSEGAEITWEGEIIPADTDVPMITGWNMIGYFPTYDLPASAQVDFYVLSSIIDRVIIAKNGAGNFILPEYGFSNMYPWSQGFGYRIKLAPVEEGDGDITFNYPAEMDEGAFFSEAVLSSIHWVSPKNSGANMSVLIQSDEVLMGELAAFNSDGVLIGSGLFNNNGQCGIAIWGDDPTTSTIDGMIDGEIPTFKYWNGNTEVLADVIFKSGTLTYQADKLAIGELDISNIGLPEEYYLSDPFPNPFNSTTSIEYHLPSAVKAMVSIFNISGKELFIVESGIKSAGIHRTSIESGILPSGTYYVVLKAGDIHLTKPITLLR